MDIQLRERKLGVRIKVKNTGPLSDSRRVDHFLSAIFSRSLRRQGIPAVSTHGVATQVSHVVHLHQAGEGEDAQEAAWRDHAQKVSTGN